MKVFLPARASASFLVAGKAARDISFVVKSEIEDFEGYSVLRLEETLLRMSMTIDFRFKITGIIKNHSPNLILDCSLARAMDSSFIATVFAAGNECEQEGGRLVVVATSAQIRKLLLIGGVHQPVTIVGSLEEAVAEF